MRGGPERGVDLIDDAPLAVREAACLTAACGVSLCCGEPFLLASRILTAQFLLPAGCCALEFCLPLVLAACHLGERLHPHTRHPLSSKALLAFLELSLTTRLVGLQGTKPLLSGSLLARPPGDLARWGLGDTVATR